MRQHYVNDVWHLEKSDDDHVAEDMAMFAADR